MKMASTACLSISIRSRINASTGTKYGVEDVEAVLCVGASLDVNAWNGNKNDSNIYERHPDSLFPFFNMFCSENISFSRATRSFGEIFSGAYEGIRSRVRASW